MKKLESLSYQPAWVSLLGALQGCLQYLDLKVSNPWLYGATGWAFVLNVHDTLCPSGPTAWRDLETMIELGPNIGFELNAVTGHRSQPEFVERQKEAWQMVRAALDDGQPCLGWELNIPEFYIVHGYDDTGYCFVGPSQEREGHKPWQDLAETGIGWLMAASVHQVPAAEDQETVKRTIEFALAFAASGTDGVHQEYAAGIAGCDNWIRALETGPADGFGPAYNAAVWSECRQHAAPFLWEARDRLACEVAPLLDQAIRHYGNVAGHMKAVSDAFPFFGGRPEHVQDDTRIRFAIEHLKVAREMEMAGLGSLEDIVSAL